MDTVPLLVTIESVMWDVLTPKLRGHQVISTRHLVRSVAAEDTFAIRL